MKLPKQEYAAWQSGPWHQANNSQRGLCCENLRITRTAAIGRSWHFVIFITFLEVRRAGKQRLAKQTFSRGKTLRGQKSIFWNCEWWLWWTYLISRTGGGGGGVLMVLYSSCCQISFSFPQQPHHICLNNQANTELYLLLSLQSTHSQSSLLTNQCQSMSVNVSQRPTVPIF